MVFKLENELSEVKQKLVNGSRKKSDLLFNRGIADIFDAVRATHICN